MARAQIGPVSAVKLVDVLAVKVPPVQFPRANAVYAPGQQKVRSMYRSCFHRDENVVVTECRFRDAVQFNDV